MFIEADDCTMGHETTFGAFGAFGGGVDTGSHYAEICQDVQRYANDMH